jgi:hypothetical protein
VLVSYHKSYTSAIEELMCNIVYYKEDYTIEVIGKFDVNIKDELSNYTKKYNSTKEFILLVSIEDNEGICDILCDIVKVKT